MSNFFSQGFLSRVPTFLQLYPSTFRPGILSKGLVVMGSWVKYTRMMFALFRTSLLKPSKTIKIKFKIWSETNSDKVLGKYKIKCLINFVLMTRSNLFLLVAHTLPTTDSCQTYLHLHPGDLQFLSSISLFCLCDFLPCYCVAVLSCLLYSIDSSVVLSFSYRNSCLNAYRRFNGFMLSKVFFYEKAKPGKQNELFVAF